MKVNFLSEASYDMYQITDWDAIEDTLARYLQKKLRGSRVEVLQQKGGGVQVSIDKRIAGSITGNKEHRAFVARLVDTNKGAKGFSDLIRAADYLLDLAKESAKEQEQESEG